VDLPAPTLCARPVQPGETPTPYFEGAESKKTLSSGRKDHLKAGKSTSIWKTAVLDMLEQCNERILPLQISAPLKLLEVLVQILAIHSPTAIEPRLEATPISISTVGVHTTDLALDLAQRVLRRVESAMPHFAQGRRCAPGNPNQEFRDAISKNVFRQKRSSFGQNLSMGPRFCRLSHFFPTDKKIEKTLKLYFSMRF